MLAAVLWVLQLIVSAFSDSDIPENKNASFWGFVRFVLLVGMFLCLGIGIVRFVKWAWYM